jgi:hypothetical protein
VLDRQIADSFSPIRSRFELPFVGEKQPFVAGIRIQINNLAQVLAIRCVGSRMACSMDAQLALL